MQRENGGHVCSFLESEWHQLLYRAHSGLALHALDGNGSFVPYTLAVTCSCTLGLFALATAVRTYDLRIVAISTKPRLTPCTLIQFHPADMARLQSPRWELARITFPLPRHVVQMPQPLLPVIIKVLLILALQTGLRKG